MDTKQIGNVAELSVALEARKRGYGVSFPFGDGQKYDLILDDAGKLFKIQVKKAYKGKNSYACKVKKSNTNRKEVKYTKYSNTDFDFAVIWLEEIDDYYIIPAKVFNDNNWSITMTPTNEDSKTFIYLRNWELLK